MSRGEHLGEFEQIVLLAVARLEDEGYGVSVRAEIEAVTGRDASVGSVYATLDRLEAKGLVTSWEGDPTPVRGGRARRHFGITPEGARALTERREMLDRLWHGVRLGEAGKA
jgi:DNA-binding PadR family transcriptional regulator